MEEHDHWQQLEALAGRVREKFPKPGEVTQSGKIWGVLSGTLRHVDLCIRTHIGSDELLVVVGYAGSGRKADRRAVEKLAEAKRDVGAQAGMLISGTGFSTAARVLAREEDIVLYESAEIGLPGWSGALDVRALIEAWELEPLRLEFALEDGSCEEIDIARSPRLTVTGASEEWDLAMVCENLWLSLGHERRSGGNWAGEIGCKVQERPEIKSLRIEVRCRLIRGLRSGKIQPVHSGCAGDGWGMVIDGEMMELPNWKPSASLKKHPVVIENIQVKTGDPAQEIRNRKIFTERLELRVGSDGVMTLP